VPTAQTVRDAMTLRPTCVPPEATVTQAAKLLAAENVGSLPVADGDALIGIVTDRDLVVNVLAKDLDGNSTRVAEVCSGKLVVAQPDDALDEALRRMARKQVRRLPVVEDGRLVGILAQADVAREASASETGAMVEQISES
jgi:CBS domain-containing protein